MCFRNAKQPLFKASFKIVVDDFLSNKVLKVYKKKVQGKVTIKKHNLLVVQKQKEIGNKQ